MISHDRDHRPPARSTAFAQKQNQSRRVRDDIKGNKPLKSSRILLPNSQVYRSLVARAGGRSGYFHGYGRFGRLGPGKKITLGLILLNRVACSGPRDDLSPRERCLPTLLVPSFHVGYVLPWGGLLQSDVTLRRIAQSGRGCDFDPASYFLVVEIQEYIHFGGRIRRIGGGKIDVLGPLAYSRHALGEGG